MACKLTPIAGSPDYQAPAGEPVTVSTRDRVGSVLIAKARYAGKDLVPEGQAVSKLQFTVATGPHTLTLVFVFSASTAGRGELREECVECEPQLLREVSGDEPLQVMRIVGS